MLDTNDTISGVCVLTNDRTGEVTRIAVLIAPSADTVTYTAQTIDRTYQETATWTREQAASFVEMMRLVHRVGERARA